MLLITGTFAECFVFSFALANDQSLNASVIKDRKKADIAHVPKQVKPQKENELADEEGGHMLQQMRRRWCRLHTIS